MDPVSAVKDIVKIGLEIKKAVDTVRENKHVCKQIGRRVERLTDILLWLEKIEATKHPAMASALKDLKEILGRAQDLVNKCNETHIVSHLFKGKSFSQNLNKVNQDIMDQMRIADFANNVDSSEKNAQIISHIKSGVHLKLAKDAGEWQESMHISHSLLLGVPIPTRCKQFDLSELEKATRNFSEDNLIGWSKCSLVYKGLLFDERVVAIKKYSIPWAQSARKFVPDFQRLHQHENIVEILGYCIDTKVATISDKATSASAKMRDDILVVEEYMPNRSLCDVIYEKARKRRDLHWSTAFGIIRGIARGLSHIHENRFIHLYLSSFNILLDSNMNPKISGFGFSKELHQDDQVITQPPTEELRSFVRYMPKVYEKDGTVSMRTDLYGFAVVAGHIVELFSSSDRWKMLHELLSRNVVEPECLLSDPLYSELCDPSICDPSHLLEIRRCVLMSHACMTSKVATMLDVLEMLDGNMQVIPKKYMEASVLFTSVLDGAPIPSRCKRFTLDELKTATSHFSNDSLIEKRQLYTVYKGRLSDERVVTIKEYEIQLFCQYVPNFQRLYQHENIVTILGYCTYTKVDDMSDKSKAKDIILVVEEYMPNGDLYDILYEGEKRRELDWPTAFHIIRGIAQGLAYIHAKHFIHLRLRAANICIFDSDMNPKIHGFQLSKKLDHENQEVVAAETERGKKFLDANGGPMPPEYEAEGIVSTKTDVYQFGKLAYFIIDYLSTSDQWKRALDLLIAGKRIESSLSELCRPWCDPSDIEETRKCIEICDKCFRPNREDRPTMPDVLRMLNDLTTKPE